MFLCKLYDRTIELARHMHAPKYLAILSFIEAVFFPIPPDVMLVPMSLAKPKSAYKFAMITTVTSILGGLGGYLLGNLIFDIWLQSFLINLGYTESLQKVMYWFDSWGNWAIFLAAFSFIPFKIIALCSGILSFSLPFFLLSSLIGRGTRFYLIAGLMRWGGAKMEERIRQVINKIGWLFVLLTVAGSCYIYY